jgi:hypothetical protein
MSTGTWSEADCLACDPFAGDYGGASADDRILSDRIVTARKGGECQTCAGPVQPGTRIRTRTEVYDGDLMSFRWCTECCEAMAREATDGGSALERRIVMRMTPSHGEARGDAPEGSET